MLPGNTVHEPYDYAVIIRQVINSQRRLSHQSYELKKCMGVVIKGRLKGSFCTQDTCMRVTGIENQNLNIKM